MSQPAPPVIFLLGPTASGKTALACHLIDQLAPDIRLEIVSVDSALVYRDMNVGTAKPDAAMQARYPHRLIDLIAPTEAYSAADFRRDALAAIEEITTSGATPLLVGGTMMYVKTLLEGLSALPPADQSVREALEAEAAQSGWPAMHALLAKVDPVTAARLAPNDSQRIQRALEVYEITGVAMSALHQRGSDADRNDAFPYRGHLFALVPSARAVLHERIAARFGQMLAAGLVDEVALLRSRYALRAELPSMRAVGYRQVWQMLEGEITLDAMREQAIAATRQLAKRQMTWLRSMPGVESFDCLDADVTAHVEARVRAILQQA
jgi:tRNA dimethylallyltransferase